MNKIYGGLLKLLKDELIKLIQASPQLSLYPEEIDYLKKQGIQADTISQHEKHTFSRFSNAYIERGDKETEEVIGVESESFLAQPLTYLKEHMNEFIYIESKWFDLIRVDAISLEVDDVFKTYDVLLGFKQPKKVENLIRLFLDEQIRNIENSYELLFNQKDGVWDINITLNALKEFNENGSIGEAYAFTYQFLFRLAEAIESEK